MKSVIALAVVAIVVAASLALRPEPAIQNSHLDALTSDERIELYSLIGPGNLRDCARERVREILGSVR